MRESKLDSRNPNTSLNFNWYFLQNKSGFILACIDGATDGSRVGAVELLMLGVVVKVLG